MMEDYLIEEGKIKSNPDSSSICKNHREMEIPLTHNSFSAENQIAGSAGIMNDNVSGNNFIQVEGVTEHSSSEINSGQNIVNDNTVDSRYTVSNCKFTEVEMSDQNLLKAEKMETDNNCSVTKEFHNDNWFSSKPGIQEQTQIKEEESETDDTSSEEEILPVNNQLPCGGVLRWENCLRNDFSNDFCHLGEMDSIRSEGCTRPEENQPSNTNGHSSASHPDREKYTSPALENVPRKRKRKGQDESTNCRDNLYEATNTREKRSAFKKCTEWFKHLKGEINAEHFCSWCNEVFSSKRELKEHQVVHDAKYTEPTDRGEDFSQAMSVVVKSFKRQDSRLECIECGERFSTKSCLSRHQQTMHTGSLTHSCEQCDRRFLRKDALLRHMQVHSDNSGQLSEKVTVLETPVSRSRKFKCDECDARFTQKWSLEQHQVIHSKSAVKLKCEECNQTFADLPLLVKHQRTHIESRTYCCGECNESFTQKTALFQHQLTHVERRKAECTECCTQFSDRSELKIHYLAVHDTKNLRVCTKCSKTFSTQAALKRHLLNHGEKKTFECFVCKEVFAQKSTLTRHALLHGGEKFYRFSCSICDRKFSRRETLVDHMRIHTGERPFVCAVCREGFTQKSAMKRHQILHFKEKGKLSKNCVPEIGVTDDILLSLVYSDT